MQYYTAIIILTVVSMLVMIVHVSQSEIIDSKTRQGFVLAFVIICIASMAEWGTKVLDGSSQEYIVFHALIKSVEFTMAPLIMPIWASVIGDSKRNRWIWPVLGCNAILEFASAKLGFIFYISADNWYTRGEFYSIYVVAYALGLVVLLLEIARFSREYQNRNLITLISIIAFLVVGVAFQLVDSELKTTWITAAISGIMLYVFIVGLTLQIDLMTRMLNRRSFESWIRKINFNTIIMVFDVDDFKKVNDTYGHAKGDLVLAAVARCIRKTFANQALCFRMAGDEFCAILKRGVCETIDITECEKQLDAYLAEERHADPAIPSVSMGSCIYDGEITIEEAIDRADADMYHNKEKRKQSRI
ncbi:MAG: GGDEF domain-containing protein [Clostridiales bacterium]|nr:GGDEF domain-containing protein [Candidatus Crickella merdequi]